MHLVCPAGSLPALKAALQQGADAVYVGFKDGTNARHLAGLNLDERQLETALSMVRKAGKQLYVAVDIYAQPHAWARWQRAVDQAAALGVDALIAADPGVLAYASLRYPALNLHLSVQGSATNAAALEFYQRRYNIRRAVLPRVLSLEQVRHLAQRTPVALEVFAFGSLCIMAEGRCHLSSYVTGESPNLSGACSPATAVCWQEEPQGLTSRLSGVLIDRYAADEPSAHPTLCKGRLMANGNCFHALDEPTRLNTLQLIPQLAELGIAAVRIEGHPRTPAYVEQATRVWREALDSYEENAAGFEVKEHWRDVLQGLSEGNQTTL